MRVFQYFMPILFLGFAFLSFNCGSCNCGDESKQKPGASLAPGTADITVVSDGFEMQGESLMLQATVEELRSIGSSTPPLVNGTKMLIKIPGHIVSRLDGKDTFKAGSSLSLLVQYIQPGPGEGESTRNWLAAAVREE